MYAETDFLLALIKDEDWLGGAAERVYHEHQNDLWTSKFTLIELLVVAYRESRDTEAVIANAAALLEVRGDVQQVLTAATYVEDHGFTPFDALHLVEADSEPIVSSDDIYDSFAPRVKLENYREE